MYGPPPALPSPSRYFWYNCCECSPFSTRKVPLFIHSFIHSFTHSFIHSIIHSFIHSLIHSLTHSLIHSLVHSFMHSFIHSFIYSFIHSNKTLCFTFPAFPEEPEPPLTTEPAVTTTEPAVTTAEPTTPAAVTTEAATPLPGADCDCLEVCRANVTQEELQRLVDKIRAELLVDTSQLSATKRKKVGGRGWVRGGVRSQQCGVLCTMPPSGKRWVGGGG